MVVGARRLVVSPAVALGVASWVALLFRTTGQDVVGRGCCLAPRPRHYMTLPLLQILRLQLTVRRKALFLTRWPMAIYSTSWEHMSHMPPIKFVIVVVLLESSLLERVALIRLSWLQNL